MSRPMARGEHCAPVLLIACFALSLGLAGSAQAQATTVSQPSIAVYEDGHPWTTMIPDPDTVRWQGVQSRPGYRYRGMLPMHERFYEYIQGKRARGERLSWGERSVIESLISARRWPEVPVPGPSAIAFLRYLRGLDRVDLNIAETMMLGQLMRDGLIPTDAPCGRDMRRIVDYLNSGTFEPRNWFERSFGRAEDWLTHTVGTTGADVRPDSARSAAGIVFPEEAFHGLQLQLDVTGVALTLVSEEHNDRWSHIQYGARVPKGAVRLRGMAKLPREGDATLRISTWRFTPGIGPESGRNDGTPVTGGRAFDVTFPMHDTTERASFQIDLAMGGDGPAGRMVSLHVDLETEGSTAPSDASIADHQARVAKTLAAMGVQETAVGKELAAMRAALAQGDAGWQRYVDDRLAAMGYDKSPEGEIHYRAGQAMNAGGAEWDAYVQSFQPNAASQALGPDLPDEGPVVVGTGIDGATVTGVAKELGPTRFLFCTAPYDGVPAGTPAHAVWLRDGLEVYRHETTVEGSGTVVFRLGTGEAEGLEGGSYQVAVEVGGALVGRSSFAIEVPVPAWAPGDGATGPEGPEQPPTVVCLFDGFNAEGVGSGPTAKTRFTLTERCRITAIRHYHYNRGKGAVPGTIALQDSAGREVGRWGATGRDVAAGAPSVFWSCAPDIVLGPGTYTLIDSDPATWSTNDAAKSAGFAQVDGYAVRE